MSNTILTVGFTIALKLLIKYLMSSIIACGAPYFMLASMPFSSTSLRLSTKVLIFAISKPFSINSIITPFNEILSILSSDTQTVLTWSCSNPALRTIAFKMRLSLTLTVKSSKPIVLYVSIVVFISSSSAMMVLSPNTSISH